MKKPVLKVRKYRHSTTHPFLLDLRAYGKGRQFFKSRADADAERLRQLTTLERHGREAIGLSQRELSDFITAFYVRPDIQLSALSGFHDADHFPDGAADAPEEKRMNYDQQHSKAGQKQQEVSLHQVQRNHVGSRF